MTYFGLDQATEDQVVLLTLRQAQQSNEVLVASEEVDLLEKLVPGCLTIDDLNHNVKSYKNILNSHNWINIFFFN